MDKSNDIINVFSALAQPTRLAVFRLLVRYQPEGLAAGDIARLLAVPHNTLSTHLAILTRANLLLCHRNSRHMIYQANLGQIATLTRFLIEDCCHNHPSLCGILADTPQNCTDGCTNV